MSMLVISGAAWASTVIVAVAEADWPVVVVAATMTWYWPGLVQRWRTEVPVSPVPSPKVHLAEPTLAGSRGTTVRSNWSPTSPRSLGLTTMATAASPGCDPGSVVTGPGSDGPDGI